MAIWNLGSINIDHVYRLDHLPRPGETLAARSYAQGLGGKGANQSIAAARAGAITHHVVDDVELSTVDADAQRVDRTRELIRRSHEEYLLASIQVHGCGQVRQDGRVAALGAGAAAGAAAGCAVGHHEANKKADKKQQEQDSQQHANSQNGDAANQTKQ